MKYAITDEFLAKLFHARSIVNVNGKKYYVTKDKNFAVGDVVLDRGDGTCGIIDFISGSRCAIRDGCVAELAVPLTRLVKLKPFNEGNVN